MFKKRLKTFRQNFAKAKIDIALIKDDDSIYCFCGYYDFLHMEFGRPTILVVRTEGSTLLITPRLIIILQKLSHRRGALHHGTTAWVKNGARNLLRY